MNHKRTREFKRLFDALPCDIQEIAHRQFRLMRANPAHPSLDIHALRSHDGRELVAARVTRVYRAVAIKDGDTMVWAWVGTHPDYEAKFSMHRAHHVG